MAAAFATLRDHARERRVPFLLTREDFDPFAIASNYLNLTGIYGHCLTVDRKDNTRGYEPGNIQPMTRAENATKQAKRDQRRLAAGFSWKSK